MIPPIADSEPDPTTQIPWPAASLETSVVGECAGAGDRDGDRKTPKTSGKRLTQWDLITLSISMAGAQITWTVELGYGTPFLQSLGLSEHLTSLVWLAGPVSGLIAQPVIGALSDSSSSKYRRRFWIILSTVALVFSTLTLAYCKPLAELFVNLLLGEGDWTEKHVDNTAIIFAVISFYILDFSLNGLQASLRNLLLDVAPSGQLSAGNAWHGRMTNAGNVVGYGFGYLPLAELPIIRLLGGDQFRKFCIICILILVVTVWITCACHEEEERPKDRRPQRQRGSIKHFLTNIYFTAINLPRPIRRVCYVQLFAFLAWFPFLFYATTYMGQVMAYELNKEPDPVLATRTGELAMLIYSVVGIVAGTVIPQLAIRDRRLMAHKSDLDQDAEISRIRATVRQWRVEAAQKGEPLQLPVMPFLLRNIWTAALVMFALLSFSTFFISTVVQATIYISLVGICWAVAMWVPFSIVMEMLKEPPPAPVVVQRSVHIRNLSTPNLPHSERQPLIRRHSFDEYDTNPEDEAPTPLAGGTVLGIHNLAIVLPQFVVAIVTSIIFKIVDGTGTAGFAEGKTTYLGKNGVAWVLRFAGVCSLFAALIARRVPPTPTEKAMRRRLGEMRLLGEESDV
jgi:solute carrier family 45 protein 1/2/4